MLPEEPSSRPRPLRCAVRFGRAYAYRVFPLGDIIVDLSINMCETITSTTTF